MEDFEILNKLKEAIIFETAWLHHSTPVSENKKRQLVEAVKVVWNRSFQRAGFTEYFETLSFDEDDVKKAAERWNRKDNVIVVHK